MIVKVSFEAPPTGRQQSLPATMSQGAAPSVPAGDRCEDARPVSDHRRGAHTRRARRKHSMSSLSGAGQRRQSRPQQATATITDDDAEPSIAVDQQRRPSSRATPAWLTRDHSHAVELRAGRSDRSVRDRAGRRPQRRLGLRAQRGDHVFAQVRRARPIVIKVKGDTLFEPDEKFTVGITDPVNGRPRSDIAARSRSTTTTRRRPRRSRARRSWRVTPVSRTSSSRRRWRRPTRP